MGGSNNSGVNVQFSDGAVAFTSNVSTSGEWTMWATQGGYGTTSWGVNSVLAPITATTAVHLTDWGPSGTGTVNTQYQNTPAPVTTVGVDTPPSSHG